MKSVWLFWIFIIFIGISITIYCLVEDSLSTLRRRLGSLATLLFGGIGASALIMFMIFINPPLSSENVQIVEKKVVKSYVFDTSLPLSVRIIESSDNSTNMIIDAYLSENEHFTTTQKRSVIKVYPPKETGKYSLEKVTVTYRYTIWFFYKDKVRAEYHLYMPEDIIKKEITLQ